MISRKDWIRIQNYLKVKVNMRTIAIIQYTRLLLVEDSQCALQVRTVNLWIRIVQTV